MLNRVCVVGFFCPKQGQGFKPSAAHLYPNIGRVSPPGFRLLGCLFFLTKRQKFLSTQFWIVRKLLKEGRSLSAVLILYVTFSGHFKHHYILGV